MDAVVEALDDTAEFVVRNRDNLASGLAAMACIGTVGTGCILATSAAVALRSEKRFREQGTSNETVGLAVVDAVLSFGTLSLVKVPAQLSTGRLVDPVARSVPIVSGRVQRFLVDSGWSGSIALLGAGARAVVDRRGNDC